MKHLIFALSFLCFFQSCSSQDTQDKKINGISFVASREPIDQAHLDPVLKLNANYAAVMPFGFIRSLDHPELIYNTNKQWFGETKVGVEQYIKMLHQNNVKVMMKPHIWIWQGEYTGKMEMKNESDWKVFEDGYKKFILEYAEVAETNNVEIFCIGTELENFIKERPTFWNQLITEVKNIYKGKLTYAANWDEYTRVPFWGQLDYIGVDAYFPVTESKTPTVEEARKGWERWKNEMKTLSDKEDKKILFTEFGYRSVNFTGKEPWKSDREMVDLNLDAQTNTTKALFEEFWNEPWFAGGFLWKWFIFHEKAGGIEDTQFSPQNKPVENVIREQYKAFR